MLLRNGYKYIMTKFQILNYRRLRAKTFAMGGSYKTICPLGLNRGASKSKGERQVWQIVNLIASAGGMSANL